jgi:hypothetical protein
MNEPFRSVPIFLDRRNWYGFAGVIWVRFGSESPSSASEKDLVSQIYTYKIYNSDFILH